MGMPSAPWCRARRASGIPLNRRVCRPCPRGLPQFALATHQVQLIWIELELIGCQFCSGKRALREALAGMGFGAGQYVVKLVGQDTSHSASIDDLGMASVLRWQGSE